MNPRTITGWLRRPGKPRPEPNKHRTTLKGGPWAGQVWSYSTAWQATTLSLVVTVAGRVWSGRYVEGRWEPTPGGES